ncbi:hypothetical protein D3C87_1745060 [compost metagenome]
MASEASSSRRMMPARKATTMAVKTVTTVGTPRCEILARRLGSRPSRAMPRKIRLWPNRKASSTVGRAMTAAAAIHWAATPCPRPRMIRARGSGLSAKEATGAAPIAAAATTI